MPHRHLLTMLEGVLVVQDEVAGHGVDQLLGCVFEVEGFYFHVCKQVAGLSQEDFEMGQLYELVEVLVGYLGGLFFQA